IYRPICFEPLALLPTQRRPKFVPIVAFLFTATPRGEFQMEYVSASALIRDGVPLPALKQLILKLEWLPIRKFVVPLGTTPMSRMELSSNLTVTVAPASFIVKKTCPEALVPVTPEA